MIRDVVIAIMVDEAARRWPSVPKLYSSGRRHSICYFVAEVMTQHGMKLGEQQARRVYRERRKLAQRLKEFLVGGVAIEPAF